MGKQSCLCSLERFLTLTNGGVFGIVWRGSISVVFLTVWGAARREKEIVMILEEKRVREKENSMVWKRGAGLIIQNTFFSCIGGGSELHGLKKPAAYSISVGSVTQRGQEQADSGLRETNNIVKKWRETL